MRKKSTSSSSPKRGSNSNGDLNRKQKKRKQFIPRSFLDCQSLTHVVGFPPQNELVTTPVASDFTKDLFLDRFVKEIVKPFQPSRSKIEDGDSSTAPNTESNAGYYHVMVGGKLVKRRRISQESNQPNKSATQSSQLDVVRNDTLARKRKNWKESIVIGTNQCLRLLEDLDADQCIENDIESKTKIQSHASLSNQKPSLIVCAKDIYPPTMCCAVPVLAKRLGIPVLLLPGKASLELGKALNAKRTSILILCGGNGDTQKESVDINSKADDDEVSKSRTAIASFVSFIKDQLPQNT